MATADVLSLLILIIGAITSSLFLVLTIKRQELRVIYGVITCGSLGLASVFALNTMHIIVPASGMAGGRPWTIVTLAGLMGLGLWSLRNHQRQC